MIGQKGMPATWGGVEQHVHNLALEHISSGNNVFVYSRKKYANLDVARTLEKENPGLNIVFMPTIATKHFDAIVSTLLATVHALIFIRPNIYHYHSVGPSLLAFLPRIFAPKAKTVITFHSPDREHAKWGSFAKKMLTLGEWTALHFSHETIVVSRDLKKYAQSEYGVATTYIPNGVNIPSLHVRKKDVLNEFGLSSSGYGLIVARLVPHKGVHHAVNAWKKLITEKQLVIVGDAAMGTEKYVEELKALAKGDARIVFTGFQTGEALESLYQNAAFTLHPSDSEGLSIALLEAAAWGKAMIASDIPANMEIVEHGGFAYEVGNNDSLQEKLQFVVTHPHAARVAGKAARSYVTKNYNWSTIAKKTVGVYSFDEKKTSIKSMPHEKISLSAQ